MKKFLFTAFTMLITCQLIAQEQVIENVLARLEKSTSMRNINDALDLFNISNESFYQKQKSQLENMFKRDSLDYSLELHSLIASENNITAIVLETIQYWKYDRTKTEIGFKTFELEGVKNDWLIHSISERVYLKGDYARIKANFEPSEKYMNAVTEVNFNIVEEGEKTILFWLNRGLKIDRIEDKKGNTISFIRKDLAVIIPWDQKLSKGEQIYLKFHFSGNFFNEFKELGYGLVNIGEEGVFGSWGTDWYPKLNGTLTKAQATIEYTVPNEFIVASVGRLESKKEQNSKTTFMYKVNTPMDYTFNANRFIHYSNDVKGVQVNVFLLDGSLDKAKMYADRSKEMIEYLIDLYGVFPCDSYGISEVPKETVLGLGGSGGQGLNYYPTNTLRDETFEFALIAHEVGHIWWGGHVSTDIHKGKLLDEGMAQVNAFLCYRHFYGEDAMWDFLNNGSDMFTKSAKFYFRQFNDDNDFPMGIYDEARSNDYAVISYLKPHFVMAMLMETIGYNDFINGIKRIISDYSTVKRLDIEGLRNVMEEESGEDLEYFFHQWFYRAGAPEFDMQYKVKQTKDGRYQIDIEVDQLKEIFQVNAEIVIANDLNIVTKKIKINKDKESFTFLTEFNPKTVMFDPHHKILRWSDKVENLNLLSSGMGEFFSGNKEGGLDKLREYLGFYPYDRTGHVIISELYMTEKKYDLAKEHLKIIVEDYENFGNMTFEIPLAFALFAKLHEVEGNIAKAEEYYSKTLKMVNIEGSHAMAMEYFSKRNQN